MKTGRTIWSHSYPCKYEDFGYRAGPRASVLVDDGRAYSLGATGYLVCLDAVKGTVLWQRDLPYRSALRRLRDGRPLQQSVATAQTPPVATQVGELPQADRV